VDRAGVVKVLDFGLVGARAHAGGVSSGTPAYLAPEMLDATRAIDHRVDLYSLGITWFELLCGRLPFRGASMMELLHLHRTAPLNFSDDEVGRIPSWMRGIVERLCANTPRTASDPATP